MTVSVDEPADDLSAAPLIRSLALLLDYDNCDELRDVTDAGPWRNFLTQMIRTALSCAGTPPDRVVIRVYGGWNENSTLSQRGSIVSALMAEVDPFPILMDDSVISGEFELALSPVALPAIILPNTFRRRAAAPRIRRNASLSHATCKMDEDCGARAVARWTKSPAKLCFRDGCAVTSKDAFEAAEQKMVDTLLAIDIVELAVRRSFSSIAVVSDDTDFIPPLIYCAAVSDADLIVMTGTPWAAPHAEILVRNGVKLIERAS